MPFRGGFTGIRAGDAAKNGDHPGQKGLKKNKFARNARLTETKISHRRRAFAPKIRRKKNTGKAAQGQNGIEAAQRCRRFRTQGRKY